MSLSSREVIKRLRAEGFKKVRQKGSHVRFFNAERKVLVTVPHPNRNLPVGTVKAIERQSGVKLR